MKKVVRIFAWKTEIFPENLEFFSAGIENFCNRIHDPQTSNQIDAAARNSRFSSWTRSVAWKLVALRMWCTTAVAYANPVISIGKEKNKIP